MADLLAAGSLLLTVITILYSIWYNEITQASNRPIDLSPQNNKKHLIECNKLYFGKALPLAVLSVILFCVNLPDAIRIVVFACSQIGQKSRAEYSAVNTTYVVVTLILAFLAIHTFLTAKTLRNHLAKMKPKPKP